MRQTTRSVEDQPGRAYAGTPVTRLWGHDFFVSFALGEPPRGTLRYATDLAKRLEKADFSVFLCEDDLPPGHRLWATLDKRLDRSKVLVVIVNRPLLANPGSVRREVERFRRKHADDRIVVVNVGKALLQSDEAASPADGGEAARAAPTWLPGGDRVLLNESEAAVERGVASEPVLKGVTLALRSTRSNVRWRWLVGGVAVLMAGLLALVGSAWIDRVRRQQEAERRDQASRLAHQSTALLARAQDQERAMLQLVAAHRLSPSPVTERAMLKALAASPRLLRLMPVGAPVASLAFSPDGTQLAVAAGDNLWLWDAGRAIPFVPPRRHPSPVNAVAYSPDGRVVVTGDDAGVLRFWATASGQEIGGPLPAQQGAIVSVAVGPAGLVVAGHLKGVLTRWDAHTRQRIRPPQVVDPNALFGAAINREGSRIATAGGDGRVRLWDARSGEPDGDPLGRHQDDVAGGHRFARAVAFGCPGGHLVASGGDDHQLRQWNKAAGAPAAGPIDHGSVVLAVAAGCGARPLIASAGWHGEVRIHDAGTGNLVMSLMHGRDAFVRSVAFSPNGRQLVSGGSDGAVRLWDLSERWTFGQAIDAQVGRITALASNAHKEQFVVGGSDGTLRLVDVDDGVARVGEAMVGHAGAVTSAAFGPGGERVASGSDSVVWGGGQPAKARGPTLIVWRVKSGKLAVEWSEGVGEVKAVAFSADGERLAFAASGQQGDLHLRSVATGQAVLPEPVHAGGNQLTNLALSRELGSRRFVAGQALGCRLLADGATGQAPAREPRCDHDGQPVSSIAFGPEGVPVVTGGQDGSVRRWDPRSGAPLEPTMRGDRGWVTAVAISPNGRRIASGACDGQLRLWDLETGAPLGEPIESDGTRQALAKGNGNCLRGVAFSPDGEHVAAAADDGRLYRWQMPSAPALALCAKLGRNMSQAEWREWVSEKIPYTCQCADLPLPAPSAR